jgi:2-keto-4-pentenoate hydratase/2-oxohepta-3-ene-1,7-dioic acid hydratase in catechol pathway
MHKLIQFLDDHGDRHWGLWDGGSRAVPLGNDVFQLDRNWWEHPPDADPIDVGRLLPPVPCPPPNVYGIGLNYRCHAAETDRPAPEKPLIFLKASTAVCGPGDPIVLPAPAAAEVDFEAELAIVVGRRARRVEDADVADYVLGYTCANDVSARDCQKRLDGQWARGKSFDTFCPLGPCLVSPCEFDPSVADIMSTLNGQRMQAGNTADMIFSSRRLVSYLSHQFTLLPGTVICTGTPAGVGMARTPPVFLRAGDQITVAVAGIGELTNPVVAESE